MDLGDVAAATQVDAYLEHAKAGSDPFFEFGGEVYRPSVDVTNRIRHLQFAHAADFRRWREDCAARLRQSVSQEAWQKLVDEKLIHETPELTDGHIASASVVAASAAFTQWLKKRDRKYVAVEMEAAGLMAALYEQVTTTRSLVLRGISDFADDRKEKFDRIGAGSLRDYAMVNATLLLFGLMQAEVFPRASAPAERGNPEIDRLKARVLALGRQLADLKDRRDRGRIDDGRYADLAADLDRERTELILKLKNAGPRARSRVRKSHARDLNLERIVGSGL